MIRRRPLFLIAGGLCLIVCGFIYDVFYAGIPYQDPTPEMSARYALHSNIASAIRWSGTASFCVGAIAGVFRLFTKRWRQDAVS